MQRRNIMKIYKTLICIISLMFVGNTFAVTVHFDSNFETAIDTGNSIVDSSGNLSQIFGDVSLSTFGSMDGAAMLFNPNVHSYEQVELILGAGASSYHIEFDILTQGLAGTGYAFTMIADTPTVQTLSFGDCCSDSIKLGNGISTSRFGVVTNDTLMHVTVDINLISSLWTADISGVGSTTTMFNSSGGDVDSLRFSLAPALGGLGLDSNVFVGIDNLVVTSVPIPSAIWLFGSGLIGLIGVARRKA